MIATLDMRDTSVKKLCFEVVKKVDDKLRQTNGRLDALELCMSKFGGSNVHLRNSLTKYRTTVRSLMERHERIVRSAVPESLRA